MSVTQRQDRVQRFLIDGVSWQTYERLLRAFDEERHFRITYDQGDLEIMTLSPQHERYKHLIGQLIVILVLELGMPIAGFGSWTMKRQKKKRGLEPDECYWIQNEATVRGKKKIDLSREHPPDLVLEIEVSRSALNRMRIYAALGVPEVWRWTGKTLEVHLLCQKGKYTLREYSLAFPFLRPAELVRFLELQQTLGEIGMLREFRNWVRSQQASGWSASGPKTKRDGRKKNPQG
jgi:Uma2 family endonuclease